MWEEPTDVMPRQRWRPADNDDVRVERAREIGLEAEKP
jgi:hypothetical protein